MSSSVETGSEAKRHWSFTTSRLQSMRGRVTTAPESEGKGSHARIARLVRLLHAEALRRDRRGLSTSESLEVPRASHRTATLSSGYFLLLSLSCFPWLVVLRCCSRRFCTQPVKGYGRGKNLSPSASRGKYGFRQKKWHAGHAIRVHWNSNNPDLDTGVSIFCQWTSE